VDDGLLGQYREVKGCAVQDERDTRLLIVCEIIHRACIGMIGVHGVFLCRVHQALTILSKNS